MHISLSIYIYIYICILYAVCHRATAVGSIKRALLRFGLLTCSVLVVIHDLTCYVPWVTIIVIVIFLPSLTCCIPAVTRLKKSRFAIAHPPTCHAPWKMLPILRPVRKLRIWSSEGLTQSDS